MNEQLVLLEQIDQLSLGLDNIKKSPKKARKQDPDTPWWKLSAEEKAIGKQGIATIRAILSNYSDSEAVSYAKAS